MKHVESQSGRARPAPESTPKVLAYLDLALAEAARNSLLRTRYTPVDPHAVSYCSNDYLGLARRGARTSTAGAGASRLVAGEHIEHIRLEQASAALVGLPAALCFTSGYAANVGVMSALAGRGDLVVSDALNHASIIDGIRLSRAEVAVVPHLDAEAVELALSTFKGRRTFVVTESYFSMDADGPDLAALRRICDAHQAVLVVDESHALGVLGPDGRGLCVQAGVVPDVVVGTYGKAFGAGGAFVAGCSSLIAWLWNRARSFVFSTGLSPVVAAAAADGMAEALARPHLRARVLKHAERLRRQIAPFGLDLRGSGPIVPWVVGRADAALSASAHLATRGVSARAIRPPTVPDGTARIRITLSAAHTDSDVDRLIEAMSAWPGASP